VAGILAERYGLTHYHYDFHDSRGHADRHLARRVRRGEPAEDPGPSWVDATAEQLAARSLAYQVERFEWVLDDLRALVSPRPILADGWGLRPDLVVPVARSPRQMVFLFPTEEFRRAQIERLPRARALGAQVSDPERAQRNRIERDRLIAEDGARRAGALGVPVIEVDGSRDARTIAAQVAEQFQPYLD
jgi:hypothetical protein